MAAQLYLVKIESRRFTTWRNILDVAYPGFQHDVIRMSEHTVRALVNDRQAKFLLELPRLNSDVVKAVEVEGVG